MTDDAPSTGSPDRPERPAPLQPDKTVMRPQAPTPAPPPDAGETVVRPAGSPGPSVDNPDVPPPSGGPAHPGPAAAAAPVPPATHGDHRGEQPPGRHGADDPEVPTRPSKAGVTSAVVAIGTGLLGAAVAIAAIRSRQTDDGDLDWSNFGVGVGATAVLLVAALLGAVAARRKPGGRAREETVTWPGVVGILGVAVMTDVAIEASGSWPGYLIGGVVVVLSALGYLAARRAAFVVTAILGLALVYWLAFDDFLAESIGEEHETVVVAAAVAVFVVVVTVLGWLLPTRAVSGVVVGAFGVAAYVGILLVVLLPVLLALVFDAQGAVSFAGGGDEGTSDTDVWWVLALAAALTVMWALAAAISDHSGFSVLAILMPTLLVPLATVALAVEHPTYWSAALAAAGGVLLLGAVLMARSRGRKATGAGYAA